MDPVTICNMALGLFGGNKIASIADADVAADGAPDEATLCNTFFEPSKLAVFEERAWLFATAFIDLGGASDSPYQTLPLASPNPTFALTSGGAGLNSIVRPLVSQFDLPDTVVRVIACDDGSGLFQIEWEKNGRKVLSEQTEQLLAKVIIKIDDPNLWPPSFQWAVAYKLASVIAGPITQSAKEQARMLELYEVHLQKAESLDGMQGATTQTARIKSESLANRRF